MNKIIFIIILVFLNCKLVLADDKSPPKVTTQQYDNWTYQCVERGKNKNCEVSQTIRIQNTNINFSVTYTKFLDEKKNKVSLITIISPLGIDLNKSLSLGFDGQEKINIPWSSCEQIGCLVFLSKGSDNSETDDIYEKVYKNFISGSTLEIGVLGYASKQPLVIQSNLKGFKQATDKLNSEY